jgi:hypothetical protein
MTRWEVDRRNELSISVILIVLVCNDCEPSEGEDFP